MEFIANKWRPDIIHLLDAIRILLNMLKIKNHLLPQQLALLPHPEPATLMESNICLKKLPSIVTVQCRLIGRTMRFLKRDRQLSISHI
jgi:hypothetical protein